jgi:osmoprotectant transport system ATP-binding protein
MVGLEPEVFGARFPSQLSGGQKQRIGVARALAADPPIVLMDEPFGALDPITRELLQNEFLELQARIRKTIIFVTHDVFEAVKMGDRVAVLDDGVLQQLATPMELVEKPANEFVDRFLGTHRFQLSLLTRTLRSITGSVTQLGLEADAEVPGEHLRMHFSLIEALDIFTRTGKPQLPLYDGKVKVRDVTKKDILLAVSSALGDVGASQ